MKPLTEQQYHVVSELAQLRIASQVIRNVIPMKGVIRNSELERTRKWIGEAIEKLYLMVDPPEEEEDA